MTTRTEAGICTEVVRGHTSVPGESTYKDMWWACQGYSKIHASGPQAHNPLPAAASAPYWIHSITVGQIFQLMKVSWEQDPHQLTCILNIMCILCSQSFRKLSQLLSSFDHDEVPDRSNLEEHRFVSAYTLKGGSASWRGSHGSRSIRLLFILHPQSRNRVMNIASASFLLVVQPGSPAHGRVVPTFKVCLPTSLT